MDKIPKHHYLTEWYKDIEFNIEPIEDVISKVGDKIFKPHITDFYQIIIISSGEGFHEVDFNALAVKANTVIPIVSGQVHAFKKNQSLQGYVIVFTPNFLIHDKANLKYIYNSIVFHTIIKPQQLLCNDELILLPQLLYKTYLKKNVYEYEEQLRSYLKLILLQLEHTKRNLVQTYSDTSIILSQRFIHELEKRINYQTKISGICNKLNTNSKKVSAAIKTTTNRTPKQLLDERIILEIKRMLSYTDLSIKEIAHNIGFEEAANLTNYFKKHTQLTPSQFRANI
jgi:AraC-like DNA-binding protein